MRKRKKGGKKMTTITLGEIETRVRTNSVARNNIIGEFTDNVKGKKLNKGRIRPKHPTESKILSMFSRK